MALPRQSLARVYVCVCMCVCVCVCKHLHCQGCHSHVCALYKCLHVLACVCVQASALPRLSLACVCNVQVSARTGMCGRVRCVCVRWHLGYLKNLANIHDEGMLDVSHL
jgi:hypothetical protein